MARHKGFRPLPGSKAEDDPTFREGSDINVVGRWTEFQINAIDELTRWWINRRERNDSQDPLGTAFGGVDDTATARTVGTVSARVFFPASAILSRGASYLVHAFGMPTDPAAVGDVYSVFALCHLYQPTGGSLMARATTIARAPSSATSLEITAVLTDPPNGPPAINITGITGITIDWKVEVYRLER